jgi:hypothetical protein
MKRHLFSAVCAAALSLILSGGCAGPGPAEKPIPHLEKRGEATQLIVDGEPFLVLAGELHNSSSSSREYMKPIWPRLDSMNLNTVLTVVEWSLVEPEEGKYDFSLVDGLLEDARGHNLRLVLLWFGAWKNGQSYYMPAWVKTDYVRFPRVKTREGKSLEILSSLGTETIKADARAFAAVMKHVKEVDSIDRTVIMIQVQNEVGILGATRDFSEAGNAAFQSPVPRELMQYLQDNRSGLLPELLEVWSRTGYKDSGTWEEVFGKSTRTDEIFMAWNYARYLDYLAQQAKQEYDIPMFVNAWIVQPEDRIPGDYPSGGPQAHVLDLWRAGAPHLDLLCPDIYLPNFAEICALYTRSDNALFIPESRAGDQGVGQLFYAIGRCHAIGYSPFGIEGRVTDPVNGPIPRAYRLLEGMAPLILEAQQKGTINAVLLKGKENPEEVLKAGDFNLHFELRKTRRSDFVPDQGYALVITLAPDEFILTGRDVQVSFSPATPGPPVAALLRVDEGKFEKGTWIPGRRLNGDAIMLDYDLAKLAAIDMTGTGIRFSGEDRNIQRVILYRYE